MPINKVENELRGKFERRQMLKRIKANTIIATTGFRDHFCTHPGRHSWDICGHPMYYWGFKAILESKYIQRYFVWTEVEEALEMGMEMSDKFVPIKRPLELCKEPDFEIIDDLKTPDSKRWHYSMQHNERDIMRNKEKEVLGSIEPVRIAPEPCYPLVTTESIDRLIEAYFLDPFADEARLFYKCCSTLHMRDPTTGYFLKVPPFSGNFGRRQQGFQMYHYGGCFIPREPKWTQGRVIGVEAPISEGIDVGDEETLRIARTLMKDRLEREELNGKEKPEEET